MTDLDLLRAALPGYDFADVLGRGAWGVVVAGQHRRLNRPVAVKMLPLAFTRDDNVRRRFATEARLLAALDHPHIVRIHDYIEQDEVCALVMELLTGGTLAERMQLGAIRPDHASAIELATLHGLEHAHQHGVLHRDVKPENLMFASDGVLKITDFGIATVLGDQLERLTATGTAMGTPAYMAPEQIDDATAIGEATDIWAAAAVYYEMLTGQVPYPRKGTLQASLLARTREEPTPISHVADVPRDISRAVMRALDRDPARRYSTSAEFADVVEQAGNKLWGDDWLTSGPLPVYRAAPRPPSGGAATTGVVRPASPNSGGRIRPHSRRAKVVVAASAAVVVAAAVVIGVVVTAGADSNSASTVAPNAVFVSSSVKGHGTAALADTATNTYWLARVPPADSHAHLTISYTFVSKFDLKSLVVWNGVGDSNSRDYTSTLRPRTVFLTFPDAAIVGCAITLADAPGQGSTLDLRNCNANGIDSVRLRIDDYYSSSGAKFVALADVQFRAG